MSLYNMMNGVNPAAFFVLPMLGKHPDDYPRFRDCFIADSEHPEFDNHIHVYTRVGGGNRNTGFGEEELYNHPEFVTTFDDSFDNTFATYIFKVPQKWKSDYELYKQGRLKEFSKEYQEEIRHIFPKLNDKFNEIWGE